MNFRSYYILAFLCAAWYGIETSFPDHLLPVGNRPVLYADTTMAGKVVGITNGDTFRLFLADSSVIKIRIAGIDCPERKQPFSTRAKQFTSDAIFSKQVQVAVQNKDRYGRYIAQVVYGRKDLGKELLRNGMAWHYVRYSSDKNLQQLEDKARAAKVGLWADENAVPPWEWRRGVGSHEAELRSLHDECGRQCAGLGSGFRVLGFNVQSSMFKGVIKFKCKLKFMLLSNSEVNGMSKESNPPLPWRGVGG